MSKTNERRLKKRFYLTKAQKGKCVYCGSKMWVANIDEPGDPTKEATIEHIIPQKLGGTEKYENIVMSCKECNNKRGHIPHEEFMEIRQRENWMQLLKRRRDERGKIHKINNLHP